MRLEEFVLLRCMFSSSAHISSRSNSVISLLESFPPLSAIRRLYARLRSSLQNIAEIGDLMVSMFAFAIPMAISFLSTSSQQWERQVAGSYQHAVEDGFENWSGRASRSLWCNF
ncbi:hypothetical protein KC19_10G079400 [Ceratodon purpureus]|uniref:Uncharacterized protein n=1 Tax=Ceratodon purpureus TaxID=3225 RepID=A0A8T0GJC7_CERPU|nr:hypothetical protein KC19_10G079400 [Ceratodon purpureus]